MMKNKLFIPLFVLTMGFGLAACQPDVDVMGTNMDIAQETLIGEDSARSVSFVSGTTMRIVEYKFLPGDKATRIECTFGDGVDKSNSQNLSYVMEFAEKNYGLNLTFTPEDIEKDPFDVYFVGNVLIEKSGDTITGLASTCNKLDKIVSQLSNSKWIHVDSALWIDTIPVFDSIKIDTVIDSKIVGFQPGVGPIIKLDTIIKQDSIFRDSLDIIGIKRYERTEMSFNRDKNTFANTGHYSYSYEEFTKDLVKVDSVAKYMDKDYRWGLSDISTERRFGIRTISDDANQEVVDLAISLFMDPIRDNDKNVIGYTMKVDGTTEFKLKK